MNVAATRRKGVRRIVRLDPSPNGGYDAVVLYDDRVGREKKKTSRMFRPLEQLVRQLSDAQSTAAIEYQARHCRSNEKKKNGWLKDLGKNLAASQRRGGKRIKITKILVP